MFFEGPPAFALARHWLARLVPQQIGKPFDSWRLWVHAMSLPRRARAVTARARDGSQGFALLRSQAGPSSIAASRAITLEFGSEEGFTRVALTGVSPRCDEPDRPKGDHHP